MKKIKNLIVFGTRPEAIKMAPLVTAFKAHENMDTRVCVTAQHREMLDQVLDFFEIVPEYDLNLMAPNQTLFSLTANIITGLKPVLDEFRPDFVYIHGDTTTTMAAGIASFYAGAKVCHVEAGLRTHNKLSPFPEEINRQIAGRVSDYHFAPTQTAAQNLMEENIPAPQILVTGNTVIDALLISTQRLKNWGNTEINALKNMVDPFRKLILVTGHRRENHGIKFVNICEALKEIALSNPDVQIIYPVHLNPNVKEPAYDLLSDISNIHLIEPLTYPAFVWLMNQSYLIITDSGGVQEEAPSLGKPVLVMRDTTERPEAVQAGTVVLVGTDKNKIIAETTRLLQNTKQYQEMTNLHNPYGDGLACKRIVAFVQSINHDKKQEHF